MNTSEAGNARRGPLGLRVKTSYCSCASERISVERRAIGSPVSASTQTSKRSRGASASTLTSRASRYSTVPPRTTGRDERTRGGVGRDARTRHVGADPLCGAGTAARGRDGGARARGQRDVREGLGADEDQVVVLEPKADLTPDHGHATMKLGEADRAHAMAEVVADDDELAGVRSGGEQIDVLGQEVAAERLGRPRFGDGSGGRNRDDDPVGDRRRFVPRGPRRARRGSKPIPGRRLGGRGATRPLRVDGRTRGVATGEGQLGGLGLCDRDAENRGEKQENASESVATNQHKPQIPSWVLVGGSIVGQRAAGPPATRCPMRRNGRADGAPPDFTTFSPGPFSCTAYGAGARSFPVFHM